MELLSKGLSFTPTRKYHTTDHLTLLTQYDSFSNSVRKVFNNRSHENQSTQNNDLPTAFLYRRMKFLKKKIQPQNQLISSTQSSLVENYLYNTKDKLDSQLQEIFTEPKTNLTKSEQKSLRKIRKAKNSITVKAADKNLGTVLLDTEDYIAECTRHLSSNSYCLEDKFPNQTLSKTLQNTIISFKTQLTYHRHLYEYLQPHKNHTIPKFYDPQATDRKCHSTTKTYCLTF